MVYGLHSKSGIVYVVYFGDLKGESGRETYALRIIKEQNTFGMTVIIVKWRALVMKVVYF